MAESLSLRVKRIYEPPAEEDGLRFLVDRLWPRGMKKQACQLDAWLKELAPSTELRRWFGHDAARWDEFCRRYVAELDQRPDDCQAVVEQARQQPVTLLYAARDPEHHHALVLEHYLQQFAPSEEHGGYLESGDAGHRCPPHPRCGDS